MDKIKFREQFAFDHKKRFYLGIEEEHWLVNHQGNLLDLSLEILKLAAKEKFNIPLDQWRFEGDILTPEVEKTFLPMLRFQVGLQSELTLSQIEINTKPNPNPVAAYADLLQQRVMLNQLINQLGGTILPTATPLFHYTPNIFPSKHYRRVEKLFAENISNGYTNGLHVHIGVSSEKEAIGVFNFLREYVPELLALSANSPLVANINTGLNSNRYFRQRSVVGPSTPEPIKSWNAYYNELEKMRCADDPTRNWKVVRIHPFGTVESRIADVQMTAKESVRIAGLVWLMAQWAINEKPHYENSSVDDLQNRIFNAANKGLNDNACVKNLSQLILNLKKFAQQLGQENILDEIELMLQQRRNGAIRQLEYLKKHPENSQALFNAINHEWLHELKGVRP